MSSSLSFIRLPCDEGTRVESIACKREASCVQVGSKELRVPGFMAKRLQCVRIRAWVLGFTVYSIVLRVVGAKIPQRRVEVQLYCQDSYAKTYTKLIAYSRIFDAGP